MTNVTQNLLIVKISGYCVARISQIYTDESFTLERQNFTNYKIFANAFNQLRKYSKIKFSRFVGSDIFNINLNPLNFSLS